MENIDGKTAFVTGGGSGIGLETARALAKRGAKVMLADINAERLAAAKSDLQTIHSDIDTVVCNVGEAPSVQAAADATIARFGKTHIVFNNAGVGLGGQPGTIPLEDWRWIVDINLLGVVYGVEVFAPLIRSHGEGGHIVNTASMAGHLAAPGMSPYNATKHAVVGLSETLRQDLEKDNIGVSVLCPAWVKTDIHNTVKNRPSGTPAPDTPAEGFDVSAAVQSGLDPCLVAEWTVDCIQANRQYIFTHPEMAEFIQARYQAIAADYAACAADPRFSTP